MLLLRQHPLLLQLRRLLGRHGDGIYPLRWRADSRRVRVWVALHLHRHRGSALLLHRELLRV
jgi:hypothetical protein